MKQLSRHLSFANVISCIALFVALSGVAYAATSLGKKSVKTQNLADGAVTALKLRKHAVTAPKLNKHAVTTPKLGKEAVTAANLGSEAVTSTKIAAENVITQSIKVGAVTEYQIDPRFRTQLPKNVSYATSSTFSTSDNSKGIAANCSGPQRKVIGGGARVLGANTKVALLESGPVAEGAGKPLTVWSARAGELAEESGDWSLEVVAICAEF